MTTLPDIVVFLGNPGERYALTRHNLGWWVADCLLGKTRRFKRMTDAYSSADQRFSGRIVRLIKPMTFMNDSGRALDALAATRNFSASRLLVVSDDIALPLGRLRIRSGGSDGGHNGLASIIESLGTDQFARIRCGIGAPPAGVDTAVFVLDPFEPEELPLARQLAASAAEATRLVLVRGSTVAANYYNRKSPAPEGDEPNPADAE